MAFPVDEIQTCGRILSGERDPDPRQVRHESTSDHEAARVLAAFRAAELVAQPELVRRTFDLDHWAAIHRHLCGDTNPVAGVPAPEVDLAQPLAALRDLTAGHRGRAY